MILRKPYAFLIKYFRIIHVALAILLIMIAYRTLGVVRFFNNYVSSGYHTTIVTGLSRTYTPLFLYLIIFLVIVFTGTLLYLLTYKKKPYHLYLLMIIYYIILFIGLFYISTVLRSFETTLLDATLSRGIRDVLILVYLPQYVFIVFIIIRAVGFDIKKFDFTNDIKELELSAKDAEEFELNIKFEGYKAKRNIRRFLREMLYYIKENRFIVIFISIVLFGIGVYLIYSNTHSNYDHHYSMGNTFTYQNLNISFEDAIVTNLDYSGNVIDDNYYVIIKTHIVNNSGSVVHLDYNDFKLSINNENINPIINYAKYFIDFASSNIPSSIVSNKDITVALVYKIKKSQINSGMTLTIYNGNVYDKGEYLDKHIYIKINADKITDIQKMGNYSINDEINFSDTSLKNTMLKIKSYLINRNYKYSYNICSKQETCVTYNDILTVSVNNNRQSNLLVILDVDFKQDDTSIYNTSFNLMQSFANNFMKIRYKIGDEYKINSINVTPANTNDFMAFEVNNEISSAEEIEVIITIRNKEYIVNLTN